MSKGIGDRSESWDFSEEDEGFEIDGSGYSIPWLVDYLRRSRGSRDCVVRVERYPSSGGDFRPYPGDLNPALKKVLRSRGIERLYSHQVRVWEEVKAGRHVVLQTPTASGKTLAYNLPVLQRLLEAPQSRALYLFPTKALSQDQVAELQDLIDLLNAEIKVFTFDGDTPQNARQAIRKKGQIVVTNPDMLHQGILPHHTKWINLFRGLSFVIIDEVHAYRGVFGSHFANVIRRLNRILRFYGVDPIFICCSATISNPREHVSTLLEREVVLISESGAPRNERYILFYNPPVVNRQLGIRASYIKQVRKLARLLLKNGLQTIIFALSRLNVEVLTKYLKDDFERLPGEGERVAGYRGGYLPRRRREIEKGLREGKVECVVATSALELGIDIGSLDAVLVAGYPGTIASTWQQFGRAGRKGDTSLGILVARSHPMDQFLMNNPEFFFGRSPESARINPDNLIILVEHIKCAAFELPFTEGESFGRVPAGDTGEILQFLAEGRLLHFSGHRWHWMADVYPAVNVNLRRIPEGNFVVVDYRERSRVIAEVDYTSAAMTIYPQAIYLVDGKQYVVDELDWEGRKAYVRPTESDYYTDAIDYTRIKVLSVDDEKKEGVVRVEQGDVQVVTRVVGFKKIKFHTMENVGYGEINLPDLEFASTAYWFTIPEGVLDDLPYSRVEHVQGIVGIAHALQTVGSILLMCEPHDIHRVVGDRYQEWFVREEQGRPGLFQKSSVPEVDYNQLTQFQPAIFLYDNYPNGVGFSEELFRRHGELLEGTLRLIERCDCDYGCPGCVGPALERTDRSKQIALDILRLITRRVLL